MSKIKLIRKIILNLSEGRKNDIIREIIPFLKRDGKILDIGTGIGDVCNELLVEGYNVTPVDIRDLSLFPGIKPIIYDGKRLPFGDNEFDISLLLTVLHHTENPLSVLKEASRVSKKLIVMEDVYEGKIQKYLTFAMDSVTNFEFFGHPHTNKTKLEWEAVFKELGLKILEMNVHNYWKFFTSATYYLGKY